MAGLGDFAARARSRLPQSRKAWLLIGVVVLLVVALAAGARYYFGDVPNRLADDYRERAAPAADDVTDAMGQVYATFDTYLEDSTLSRYELRTANDFDELRRRWLPVFDATEDALRSGERAIEKARSEIEDQRAVFADVPSAPLLGDSQPVTEAEEAAAQTATYLDESERFLKNYERFIKYELKQVDLSRRGMVEPASNQLSVNAPLDAIKSAVSEDLEHVSAIRGDLLDLEPHTDVERLHDYAVDIYTVLVDYYQDVQSALNNLDLVGLRLADKEFLAEVKGTGSKGIRLTAAFAHNSSIQRQSRKLGELEGELEATMAGLGSGTPEGEGLGDEDPPRAPMPPGPPSGGGGGGEDGPPPS